MKYTRREPSFSFVKNNVAGIFPCISGKNAYTTDVLHFVGWLMERSISMVLALLLGVEPVAIGFFMGIDWLILVGLCNILVILLRYKVQPQQKSNFAKQVFSYVNTNKYLQTPNTYFGAIACIALVAGVVTYVLRQGDVYAKIAWALMIAGVLYWLFAAVTHGVKLTRSAIVGKLFLLLIVAGAGWIFLGSQSGQTFLTQLPITFKKFITIPKVAAPIEQSGTVMTGVVTTPVIASTGVKVEPKPTVATGVVAPATGKDTSGVLTFAQVVPALVQTYNLVPVGPDVTFANISKTDPLYAAFKAGYNTRFYGLGVKPDAQVSCNVYFVLLGLAQKRQVTYNNSTIFTAYAEYAQKEGATHGCVPGAMVTQANLP